VLSLLKRGYTNNEICKALNISSNTVKVHLAKIYKLLNVANRTEAASSGVKEPPKKVETVSDVTIAMSIDENLKGIPLVSDFFLSLVESLHRYHVFIILENEPEGTKATYRIRIPQADDGKVFVFLYHGGTNDMIWSSTQKIDADEGVEYTAMKTAVHLYRQMQVSASHEFQKNRNMEPFWWYASCHACIKIEGRARESFGQCELDLLPFAGGEESNIYATFTLVSSYYTAICESWVNASEYTEKIGKMACAAMRTDPYSIYSQFMMALFNILIGNKSDAIAYFRQVLESCPQEIMARRLLTQVYMLVGEEDKALQLLDENERLFSELTNIPFLFIARAFIYMLQGRLDECEKVSRQVLLIHPETPFARLFVIACCNKKGDMVESRKQTAKFFEFHPNFRRADLEKLIEGIAPGKKDVLVGYIDGIFSK